ncbi:MAG: leucine-rich repeat domain-containing protein, partial [Paludibacteraceae bacterium]|nr:leucine-rich repeat domain-containing protein [Paludibacteraceae bacterium]
MKKILLALSATFAVCLAVFAGTNMCVKKQNGDILRINVDDVYEVYFEDIFNPDTSSIIPPFIEPTVADTSAYAPLIFEITSDSTAELTYGNYRDLDSVNIPAKVKIDEKIYDVTTIGSEAFYGCSSLTSITIPESVTSIGSEAFYDCDLLKPQLLVYDNGTKCYGWIGNKDSCISVVIPESVTEIGYDAFWGCRSLASITIPESVTSIGSEAFYDCSSLTSITIPKSVTSIGSSAFMSCSSLTS